MTFSSKCNIKHKIMAVVFRPGPEGELTAPPSPDPLGGYKGWRRTERESWEEMGRASRGKVRHPVSVRRLPSLTASHGHRATTELRNNKMQWCP